VHGPIAPARGAGARDGDIQELLVLREVREEAHGGLVKGEGAAIQQGVALGNNWLIGLVFVGVINAIVGLYYYLTVLKVVYLYPPRAETKVDVPRAYRVALWACVIGILLLGTWSTPWIGWATAAAGNLF